METQTKHLRFKFSNASDLYTKLQAPIAGESFGLRDAGHRFESQPLSFERLEQHAAWKTGNGLAKVLPTPEL
jgi:hypothetical protein